MWWTRFKQNFQDAFTFTMLKETALAKLEKLIMEEEDLNIYIATFNQLLDEAEFSSTNKGMVEMFK
jgi:hypothetical protein